MQELTAVRQAEYRGVHLVRKFHPYFFGVDPGKEVDQVDRAYGDLVFLAFDFGVYYRFIPPDLCLFR